MGRGVKLRSPEELKAERDRLDRDFRRAWELYQGALVKLKLAEDRLGMFAEYEEQGAFDKTYNRVSINCSYPADWSATATLAELRKA